MTYCFASQFIYTVDPKLPKPILKEMFKQCKALHFDTSPTYRPEGQDIRHSKQHWLPWDTWIASIIHNIFISANNNYFHYDLDHFDSGVQVTKYDIDDHYSWHVDMLPVETKECNAEPCPEPKSEYRQISWLTITYKYASKKQKTNEKNKRYTTTTTSKQEKRIRPKQNYFIT